MVSPFPGMDPYLEDPFAAGPYDRGALDYSQPPIPPLPSELVEWAAERIRHAFEKA